MAAFINIGTNYLPYTNKMPSCQLLFIILSIAAESAKGIIQHKELCKNTFAYAP